MSRLRVAMIVPVTEAEGPGRRFAVWLQGCPMRCPGCCNPEMLPFEGGEEQEVGDLVQQLRAADVEGVTLLGGEPFAQPTAAAELARATQAMGRSVMIFTGYTLAELHAMSEPAVAELLRFTDLLVDGRYERDLPDPERRWIGSTNQQVHFLTDRHSPADPQWRSANTIELRLVGGNLAVNGFPAPAAIGLWRRPT